MEQAFIEYSLLNHVTIMLLVYEGVIRHSYPSILNKHIHSFLKIPLTNKTLQSYLELFLPALTHKGK